MSVMKDLKKIALVAHDAKKSELMEWVRDNIELLKEHQIYATGTTGLKIEKEIGINVIKFKSGPLGGDQQIGSAIVEEKLDVLIFFWDPLSSQPHDPDVKALLRVAALWNAAVACNKTSADFILQSPLMKQSYRRDLKHILQYTKDRTV
ncbi:methylglyoxal synthase [Bacteriovorax sp. DB6_IX]|nr:methylglyoxal synthase [Bacteriovorax sp. DB6_IX]EQC51235.1 methylglyoxal synthase [Bacteriovorax sp. DB6_IX]